MTKHFVIAALIIVILILAGAGIWWRVHSNAAAAHTSQITMSVMYSCLQGKTIQALYAEGRATAPATLGEPPQPSGTVQLTLSDGRSMTLPQTLSGSGIRYSNAEGSIVFWSEGNSAFMLENNEQTYTGCVAVVPDPGGLPQVFANASEGFSLRYSVGYTVTDPYTYEEMGPGKGIGGVEFMIAPSVAAGTNLNPDSYLSVELIPNATSTCNASLFLQPQGPGPLVPETVTDNGTTYSVASSTGAAAGNRYEEWVYAIPGTSPCRAVRYFIHYGVIENYPPGTVQPFDQAALISQFDTIRRTLTLL